MKKLSFLSIQVVFAALLLFNSATAQYSPRPLYTTKPAATPESQSNWLLNVGIGYGNYYGDMSNYRIRRLEDIGLLRNFVNYNSRYIKEPSFHLSAVKRLGKGATGLGLNFNRTLIQSSDRYVSSSGILRTDNPFFARSLNFKTDILDAGLSLNFNSFSKGFFTPYFSLGTGISFFDVKGDVFTGANQNIVYNYNTPTIVNDGIFETDLRDARTETSERYQNKALYAQAVLGFNFRFSKHFSLGAETDIKYSGSDYLDDLSGTYKTTYPSLRSQYIAQPGYNTINPQMPNRGYNDGVNDFYIQTRVVLRFHIPKYLKRAEAHKVNNSFNAPVLYPGIYPVHTMDSSAYLSGLNRGLYSGLAMQRRKKDSLAKATADSVRADSLRLARTYNVKMDTAYLAELKALRQEISSLRQTIQAAIPKPVDSVRLKRAILKDSLTQNLQQLQWKKKKTSNDSLQLRIYQLRLDSIGWAEKYAAVTKDSLTSSSATDTQTIAPVPAAIITTTNNSSHNDSLRKIIDSIHTANAAYRIATPLRSTTPTVISQRTIRNVRDTLTPQQTQQYQQQIAGLNYRSRQAGLSAAQVQSRLDSIQQITAAIRASDAVKTAYYEAQLLRAKQQEAALKEDKPKGLFAKKPEVVKNAERERESVEAALQQAQATRQKNSQNTSVAAGDTAYIMSLQQQVAIRQAQIDSLKNTKKVTDIFSSKNKRIKELEEEQQQQRRQLEEANRMLQYYRNTGPTSYFVPQYYPQNNNRQIDNLNNRVNDLQRNRDITYNQPPVNVVSPVVVSGNNEERFRMQREIDSLRSQVARLNQSRGDTFYSRDTIIAKVPTVDTAANRAAAELAALQLQLAELNNRLQATVQKPAATPIVADTTGNTAKTTVYFSRGSAVLTTLQKAKLSAFVKKGGKNKQYSLTSSTDNTTGNTAANEALAQKRIANVAAYLKTRGVAAANISSVSDANNGSPHTPPDPLARKVDVEIL